MPVTLTKLPNGKMRVSTPNGVKSKSTSLKNAIKQKRLLNAVENNSNFRINNK